MSVLSFLDGDFTPLNQVLARLPLVASSVD